MLSPEEKFILDTLRSAAKILGSTTAHREYQRRMLYARKMAAMGDTKAAAEEFEIIRTKSPQLWKFGKLLLRVYQEGFHDGAHESGMRNYLDSLDTKLRKDPDDSQVGSRQ